MDATIESIEVKVGKKTYKFSAEEAKALCDALTSLFTKQVSYVPYPTYPSYPLTWYNTQTVTGLSTVPTTDTVKLNTTDANWSYTN